uniref:HL01508p n=1 Tax=Drosophila melanogaster TaxID=7227 RepID=Q95S16_DROME|nr:HL01508p [Drosophila melanogaster]
MPLVMSLVSFYLWKGGQYGERQGQTKISRTTLERLLGKVKVLSSAFLSSF